METHALAQRVLARAAARKGGTERLAAYLGVTPDRLQDWMNGREVPPVDIVLRAVDLLIGDR